MEIFDQSVADWARQQNRGVPPWNALDRAGRSFWRERFLRRADLAAMGSHTGTTKSAQDRRTGRPGHHSGPTEEKP